MKAELECMVGELGSQTSGDGHRWAAEEVASVFSLPHAILWPGSSLQAGPGLAPVAPFRVNSHLADRGVLRPTATCVCRPFHLSVLLLTELHQKIHW